MLFFNKRVACFILCLTLLATSPVVQSESSSFESLKWLPLLTANINKLQLDKKNCPQNQIKDLKVNKQGYIINSDIRLLTWDLSCGQNNKQKSATLSETEQDILVKQLLMQLKKLPSFKLRFNTVNLLSDLLKNKFSSSVYFKKNESSLFSTVISDLINAKVTINLQSNQLMVDASIKLEAVASYIDLTAQQSRYLSNDLILHYESDLKQWHKGKFKVNWQGEIPEITPQLNFYSEGRVNVFKQALSLSTFSIQSKKIEVEISEAKRWKASYFKLKLSEPATFNYGQKKIESLPVHVRIGSSVILTKVARGKSQRIRIDKQKLPPLLLQASVSGRANDLAIKLGLTLLNQKIKGRIHVGPETVLVELLENKINLKTLIESARRYASSLELLALDKGMLYLDFTAKYHRQQQRLQFSSLLTTDKIAGKNDGVLFDGVSLFSDLKYRIDKQKEVTIERDKLQLKADNVFIGVPIQAMQIDAQVNAGQPVVQHFKARLLGGRVDFDDFKLVSPSQTVLNIAGISLAEIVKYSAYPEIGSKAILDGMLPLALTENGPEIKEGLVFSRAPGGYIRVPENSVVKAMGRGNPAFSFTMQLLSNFQFDTLQGNIRYTSDGESDLKVEIKGISPNISGTQPINFNYSHHENILKLLKSLRFNDELVRDIKERY